MKKKLHHEVKMNGDEKSRKELVSSYQNEKELKDNEKNENKESKFLKKKEINLNF